MSDTKATDIWRMGILEMAEAVRSKEISCREGIESHLDRIETVNPKVNALTVVLREEALRLAQEADKRLARGEWIGPLHGVPMTVKENIDLAGSATTFGVSMMKDAFPAADAPHVSQLKQAGAIPIGRTNLPDLGLRAHTGNRLWGETLNPWDPSRTPGGSSGGDAVAVATGMTPLGLGNDYGGSLRCPAQFCGVATLRPTLGRVPDHMTLLPAEPAITLQLFMVQGPIARRVSDLKAALWAMSGPDARDPRWVPAPLSGPPPARPLRVAVSADPGGHGCDPGVADGVRKAARWLLDAGCVVEEMDPPSVMEAMHRWLELTGAELRTFNPSDLESFVSPETFQFLSQWIQSFPQTDLPAYMQGLAERNRIAREWAQFQEHHPLILGPVTTMRPFPLGYDIAGAEAFHQVIHSFRLNMAVNLLGLPSAVVPVGLADGLPQAVQIIGPHFREDLCLEAAQILEERAGTLTPIDPCWMAESKSKGQTG